MEVFLYLCFLIQTVLVFSGDLHPRGCIYIDGICQEECEIGTHAYTTGCGYLMPEATCQNPYPKPDFKAKICDFSACYCDFPTVRHNKTKKCVMLDECKNYD